MEENNEIVKSKKNGKIVGIIIGVLVLVIALIVILVLLLNGGKKEDKGTSDNGGSNENQLSAQEVSKFDLEFLKLENKEVNMIYSPLSIKYALAMLNEGAAGNTQKQIGDLVGNYTPKLQTNNSNKSFANALFIKESFKDSILDKYVTTLKTGYNAEVIYDSFATPTNLNNWVSQKTFNLIDDLFDDISNKEFILVNALAIDMEWNKKIQPENEGYDINFKREKFNAYVSPLSGNGYSQLDFNGYSNRNAVKIAAVANRYDIINELGEDNIRNTVKEAYNKWIQEGAENACENPAPFDTFIETYMSELKENYGHISSSTDFLFYDDEEIKVFAKDLKEYDGSTLEYVGIMPKSTTLSKYIENINADKLNTVIKNLKSIELNSFEDGTITYIHGYIPLFNFDYELSLMDDLMKLGITDVFDNSKADLSNLTSTKGAYISSASHKANIEFSNDGIKAAAATQLGGLGAWDCGFEYDFDVPVKEIDLTFDNPYMFLIRDKATGEVWFVGTVYEPEKYKEPVYNW